MRRAQHSEGRRAVVAAAAILLVALVASSLSPFSSSSPSSSLLLPVSAQWFSDPCQYHPHVLQQLRLRFQSIVGQQYATDAIYAHIQQHLEQYEQSRLHRSEEDAHVPLYKPLVLSFHGPTGTGKSLTANSISSALFHKSRSSHVHTYHGSDFSSTSPMQVAESISFLKREFSSHVRRCPLALFIIEEIHLMAPGVLDGLRHLMDAQAPNTRIKIDEPTEGSGSDTEGLDGTATGGPSGSSSSKASGASSSSYSASGAENVASASSRRDSPSAGASSVAINFSHVIWLFTTNIGSQQVQKVAYDAAKEGKSRESLSPQLLHDMLLASLAHSEQLQLLRDSSVLSALIPFFPLFKIHVKECAAVQLAIRRKYWLHQRQLGEFAWDSSVTTYAAGQLKYQGPISIYGCKNIHEILTHVLLSHLTRTFRRMDEEASAASEELMRDGRVGAARKFLSYSTNLFRQAAQMFTGPTWNLAQTNVTVSVQQSTAGAGAGDEEIVFELVSPPTAAAIRGARGPPPEPVRSEIRKSLHAYAHSAAFHSVPETHTPGQHTHMSAEEADSAADNAHLKEEL